MHNDQHRIARDTWLRADEAARRHQIRLADAIEGALGWAAITILFIIIWTVLP